MAQLAALLVEQVDGERVVRDDAGEQLADLLEELVLVESLR